MPSTSVANKKTSAQQKVAAHEFVDRWKDKGYEKGETQLFWLDLMENVLGDAEALQHIDFEVPVQLGNKSYIDAYIPETSVLIEQKSKRVDLAKGYKQSDGSILTPYQQARRYSGYLPYDRRPRWIVVSNFREIHIHDMNRPNDPPEVLLLEDLPNEVYRLRFLTAERDENIRRETKLSVEAGDIVAELYDEIKKQYIDPDSPESLESLNVLCVRLVFCLYAEDADLFDHKGAFYDYLSRFEAKDIRGALIELFKVLDQKPEERDPYLQPELAAFPYVNGGLFARTGIEIPNFTDWARNILLNTASKGFDWSKISPTIFGAIFESTMNPEARRVGGMHYTSIENIHKVIDPLFLDDLKDELEEILETPVTSRKNDKTKTRLLEFQKKLGSLVFLDPACGSGNFLTETYLSLRRLENIALQAIYRGQVVMGKAFEPIKVQITQFHGIEINDFAVSVAQTALWIAESQMMRETEEIVNQQLDFLPLTTAAHIVAGNALRLDWNRVVPRSELNYIMGNPPFVGKSFQTPVQKADMQHVLAGIPKAGNLDYVACWFKKASDFIENTLIQCAFVATNSICQGVAVPPLWSYLLAHGVHIDFAYRTFRWNSQATAEAHVHVVIVGFSTVHQPRTRLLYMNDDKSTVVRSKNINPYLLDAPNVVVVDRAVPVVDVPPMQVGSFPTDGGNLVITSDEYESFWRVLPERAKFVRPYIGPEQLIKGKQRYCLWLKDTTPAERRSVPAVTDRIAKTKAARESSSKLQTQRKAATPHLFAEDRQPDSDYVMIPRTSSERRRYIPMGFFSPDVIAGDTIVLPKATLFEFGIIVSNVHMAWMRTVAGRLEMRYRYSPTLVYNTFPWPSPSPEQRAEIERTAQAILDARELYPDSSLADLYDEVTMPPELRKAHQDNDRAVMRAYGLRPGKDDEAATVAHLMEMYQELTKDEH